MNRLIGLGGLSAALVLQACGGGGYEASVPGTRSPPPPPPPPPVAVKIGGLWQGVIRNTQAGEGTDAVAMIAEDGRLRVVALDNDATIESKFAISKASFQGGGQLYAGFLDNDTDTPYGYDIQMWGTLSEYETLTITWSSAWDGEGVLKFIYDPELYEVPSSLMDLEGTWTGFTDDDEPWVTLTIDADGQFAADVISGCSPTGRFAVIDERFNLYDVEGVVFDCDTESTFSGFAYTIGDNASAPELFLSIDNGTEALRLKAVKD